MLDFTPPLTSGGHSMQDKIKREILINASKKDRVYDVLAAPNTLVEFNISEHTDSRRKALLTQSAFASLPTERTEAAFNQNSAGCDFRLNRLVTFSEAQPSE